MKIESGLLQRIENELSSTYSSICLITDDQVGPLHPILSERLRIQIPAGERFKTPETAAEIWKKMALEGCDRNTLVVGLGGGVITDLSGFVASCYMRGVDLCLIPTTLLAMVDAAVGGKTAVNLIEGKNLVGSFYPASYTFMDPAVLHTLSDRHFCSGIAEVIKTAAILDAGFFSYLEDRMETILDRNEKVLVEVIRRTAELKLSVVEKDPKDTGFRACLNFGHTFGHAIETATQYQRYEHGEAVAIGMMLASRLSYDLGLVDEPLIHRLERLLKRTNLPTELPDIQPELLLHLMKRDKKAVQGGIVCVVLETLGNAYPMQIDEKIILQAVRNAKSFPQPSSDKLLK